MNARILLSSLLILSALSGCSWLDKIIEPVVITVQEEPKTPLNLEAPTRIRPKPVKWIIITPENADEVFKRLKTRKTSLSLFALTDRGYENLALNMAEIRAYLLSQKGIIGAYQQYYEPPQSPKPPAIPTK